MNHPSTATPSSPGGRRGPGLRGMLTAFTVAAVAATALIGGVSLWGARQAGNAATQTFVAKDVTADILPPPMYLIEMRLVLSQGVEGTLPLDKLKAEVARLQDEYQARVKFWQANPPYGLESHLLGQQHSAGLAFIAAATRVVGALEAKADAAAVHAALTVAHEAYAAHRAGVDATVKNSAEFAEASMTAFDSTATAVARAQWLLLGLSAFSLSLLGVWIRRKVWASVGAEPAVAAAMARAVAQGDLSLRVPVAAGDHHSIVAAMEQMRTALSGIVTQVRTSSDHIDSGSREIARGNGDLGARTEQQAAALEQTAASMEQLHATARQTADTAQQANQLAVQASRVAARGGDVVGQVVHKMQGIHDSSTKIASIIGVIDGIAFQTNILALNAAVEAARAGEQGRGFAVVAAEVRSLAGRSAEAAREIKALIAASVDQVEQGTALVGRAGSTMTEVVDAIGGLTGLMGDITAASAEQDAGVAQVGAAIGQIDQATQRNAALVGQCAAASDLVQTQAQRLVQEVAVFTLARDADSATPRALAAHV